MVRAGREGAGSTGRLSLPFPLIALAAAGAAGCRTAPACGGRSLGRLSQAPIPGRKPARLQPDRGWEVPFEGVIADKSTIV